VKKAVIWDLDGTLFDSYGVIVESIYETFSMFGICCSREEIHRHAICFSIQSLFAEYGRTQNVDVEQLNQTYSKISSSKYLDIQVMKQGREVLEALAERGTENYVFTHRGKTTIPVLNHLQLTEFFRDIITSQSGFARKPDPEGLQYLIAKYNLDPARTYYVGDRRIDMECAKNAGITGVLYMPEHSFDVSGSEKLRVKSLLDILKIV